MPKREVLRGPNIPEHAATRLPAVKIGNMVYSAAVGGDDPDSHGASGRHRNPRVQKLLPNHPQYYETGGWHSR